MVLADAIDLFLHEPLHGGGDLGHEPLEHALGDGVGQLAASGPAPLAGAGASASAGQRGLRWRAGGIRSGDGRACASSASTIGLRGAARAWPFDACGAACDPCRCRDRCRRAAVCDRRARRRVGTRALLDQLVEPVGQLVRRAGGLGVLERGAQAIEVVVERVAAPAAGISRRTGAVRAIAAGGGGGGAVVEHGRSEATAIAGAACPTLSNAGFRLSK